MISLHSPAFCTTVLFCHVLSYLPLSYPTLSYTILFSSYCPILFNLLVRHALCNIRELNTPYLLVSSHYISHLIRSSLCVSHYAGLFVSLSLSLFLSLNLSLSYRLFYCHSLPLSQGLGHPYRDSVSVQTNVADIVSRQGAFIQGDLEESVHRLVADICSMIRRPCITPQDSEAMMEIDNSSSSFKRKEFRDCLEDQ